MTVLHVITGLGNGGAEAVLVRLIHADQSDRHVVVSLTSPGTYGDSLADHGVRVVSLNLPRGRFTLTAIRQLDAVIRDVRPDIVQTWMYHADLAGGVAARFAGVGAVAWGVHSSNLDADKTPRSTRLVARLCAALSGRIPRSIVCCSEAAASMHAAMGYRRDKLVVVSNGLDLSEFREDPAARLRLRAEMETPEGCVVFGMVGRWHPLKDHFGFIHALGLMLNQTRTEWQAWLVGPGVDEENAVLMQTIRAHGLGNHVRCLGARSDVPAVMNAIDLHILPSVGESFGNVTVEAMACGTPAIVTDVGAGAFIVGDSGWVVSAKSPSKLSETMLSATLAMMDRPTWRARRHAARARAEAEFGVARMVERYRQVWIDAVGRDSQ